MKKSDLKTGMIVTLRSGCEYMVFLDVDHNYDHTKNFLVNGNNHSWISFQYITEELFGLDYDGLRHKGYDIMKIESLPHPFALQEIDFNKSQRRTLWERVEIKEMTVAEIEKALGYKIKIVKEER